MCSIVLSFGLWHHQEDKDSHGQAVCQLNDETETTKTFLYRNERDKICSYKLIWISFSYDMEFLVLYSLKHLVRDSADVNPACCHLGNGTEW